MEISRILSLEGFEAGEYDLSFSESAGYDGAAVLRRKVSPRPLTLQFDVFTEQRRVELISFFNPKNTGTMYVERYGVKRKIDYEIEAVEFSQPTLYSPITVTASLICPQPFLLSVSDFGQNIAARRPMFAFPWQGVVGKGQIMGYRAFTQEVNLYNGGDVSTGITAVLTAKRGPVTNPSIRRGEQFIRVVVDMAEGDELTINTNQKQKRIELNGVNIFQKIDRQSTFFDIAQGDNIISYDADANYVNLDVRLYYTQKYLGV